MPSVAGFALVFSARVLLSRHEAILAQPLLKEVSDESIQRDCGIRRHWVRALRTEVGGSEGPAHCHHPALGNSRIKARQNKFTHEEDASDRLRTEAVASGSSVHEIRTTRESATRFRHPSSDRSIRHYARLEF